MTDQKRTTSCLECDWTEKVVGVSAALDAGDAHMKATEHRNFAVNLGWQEERAS
jgi:hypothetical protein